MALSSAPMELIWLYCFLWTDLGWVGRRWGCVISPPPPVLQHQLQVTRWKRRPTAESPASWHQGCSKRLTQWEREIKCSKCILCSFLIENVHQKIQIYSSFFSAGREFRKRQNYLHHNEYLSEFPIQNHHLQRVSVDLKWGVAAQPLETNLCWSFAGCTNTMSYFTVKGLQTQSRKL